MRCDSTIVYRKSSAERVSDSMDLGFVCFGGKHLDRNFYKKTLIKVFQVQLNTKKFHAEIIRRNKK
jgi:hypothetical protein